MNKCIRGRVGDVQEPGEQFLELGQSYLTKLLENR